MSPEFFLTKHRGTLSYWLDHVHAKTITNPFVTEKKTRSGMDKMVDLVISDAMSASWRLYSKRVLWSVALRVSLIAFLEGKRVKLLTQSVHHFGIFLDRAFRLFRESNNECTTNGK